MKRGGLIVGLVVVLAGCSMLGARTFGFAFPAEDDLEALPVLLTDTTGSVVDADVAPPGFQPVFDKGFSTIAENPTAVVVHWVGGACDASVSINATGGATLELAVITTAKPGGCDAIGIARAALIQLSRRADASSISVRFEP